MNNKEIFVNLKQKRMLISLGNDHAGVEAKKHIEKYLNEKGIKTINRGYNGEKSVDYPDYIHKVAEDVDEKKADAGIIFCGSGNGAAMTANKHQGVRAAICWNKEIAALAKKHNNANIISIPSRFVAKEETEAIIKSFLEARFEGGRHERRVKKIPKN